MGNMIFWRNYLPTRYALQPISCRASCETGTQNHEGIAGVLGAVEYFEWVGRQFGTQFAGDLGDL